MKLKKIDKVDISLKQLIDVDSSTGITRCVDCIGNGMILMASVSKNVSVRDSFIFKNLSDIVKGTNGVLTSVTNGILTLSVDPNAISAETSLSELSDVAIAGLADNDYLVYNSVSKKWENSQGSFVPTTRTITINGVIQDLSADRTWTISSGSGTVTSVTGTGTVSGLTLSGNVTTSGSLTLGGSLTLTSGNVTTALGFTPISQATANGLYYPLSSNPSNYVTSSSLSSTLSSYLTIASAASTYQPIFTTDNGLTYASGYLKLGGQLTQNTTIDGKDGVYSLSLLEMSQLTLQASDLTDSTEINLTTTQMQIKTPLYGSASVGDVLTILDPTTGEAEWQTPTGGGGGPLYGAATQVSAGVYTASITGAPTYTAGDTYIIKFDTVNDGASTLNINSQGAVNIYKNTNFPIASGDIKANQVVEIVYDGTNFQAIGLVSDQLLAYVYNDEGAVISKGQAVYAYQASGNKMSVKLAKADQDSTSAKTIGLVYDTTIGVGGSGYIIIQGVIEGVNTAAFSAGNTLYLSGSTFGGLTATKPSAPTHLVYVGIVERANAGNGQIYVRTQNGYELDEIHDVDLVTTAPANNDVLVFDTSTTPDLWKPKSIPTILGYTPAPADLPEISVSTANAREDNYSPTGWPGTSNIVKVIRINSTNTDYMMSLGGLSNPTAGRVVTIYNASTANNLIIIENLSTSSTAANRFRMTANMPYFLLPNRSITFLYDGTYWTQLSASNSGGFDFFDDCTGGGSAYVTTSSVGMCGVYASGTGAGVRSGNLGANDSFGEYNIQTGTTTTGFASVSIQTRRAGANNAFGAYIGTYDIPYITVSKIGLSALATVAQDYRVHFGMNGNSSLPLNAPGVGYLWSYEGTATPAWTVRTQNTGGTVSTVTTALTATTNYVWLGVYKPGGANIRDAVYFYSTNGVIYEMASKFVGTVGAYGGSPTAVIGAIAGTTAKELSVDWIGTSFNLAR